MNFIRPYFFVPCFCVYNTFFVLVCEEFACVLVCKGGPRVCWIRQHWTELGAGALYVGALRKHFKAVPGVCPLPY